MSLKFNPTTSQFDFVNDLQQAYDVSVDGVINTDGVKPFEIQNNASDVMLSVNEVQNLFSDGTTSNPGISFVEDPNTGIRRSATDLFSLVAGSYEALNAGKSAGNYANIGMGGNASLSDNFPLVLSRSVTGGTNMQITNPKGGASDFAKLRLGASLGATDFCELFMYPRQPAVPSYDRRAVLRSGGSADGLSLIGSGAAQDVQIYAGGVFASAHVISFNIDGTMTIHKPVDRTTVASPAATDIKLLLEDDCLWVKDSSGNTFDLCSKTSLKAIKTVTTNTTLTQDDYTILVDASSGNLTITLPTASSSHNGSDGRIYNIKKTDSSSNTVTVDGNGAETIDGNLTMIINSQYDNAQIQTNGTGWYIL